MNIYKDRLLRGAVMRAVVLLQLMLLALWSLAPLAWSVEKHPPGPMARQDSQQSQRDTAQPKALEVDQAAMEKRFGVKVKGLYLTAAGYMLDFRYTVTEPAKAKQLVTHKTKAYAIAEKSGFKFQVPNAVRVGPLRQRTERARQGKEYFAMFANPGRYIKAGEKVTVVIGDFKLSDQLVTN